MPTRWKRPLLALLAVATLAACDEAPDPDPRATDADAPAMEADARAMEADSGAAVADVPAPAEAPVRVWFVRGDSLVAVPRPGTPDSLRAALESLLAGPTPEERARGLSSWFGEETRNALGEVHRESGRAVVDFRASLPEQIPGAGSSAGSAALLAALDSTVFQFPWVEAVEYRLGGSCDAFWSWLQRECAVVRR